MVVSSFVDGFSQGETRSVPFGEARFSLKAGQEMYACMDVHYSGSRAVGACVLFESWDSAESSAEVTECIKEVQPYKPGRFYERDLPVLLAVLDKVRAPLDMVVVDGYVWLSDGATPGLGAKLYQALNEKVPVIGVAKNRLVAGAEASLVYRGRSRRPLYVTAAGIGRESAAARIRKMHGGYRIPTLLKHADRLCRTMAAEVPVSSRRQ
jgi:deoxyribonuclease V